MKTLFLDAINLFRRLEDAICDPALEEFDRGPPSEKAREAAARLLVAVGLCNLAGIRLDEERERIPTATALGAIDVLLQWTGDLKKKVDELPERCAEAVNDEEVDQFCADVLTGRMRLWAAEITLNGVAFDAINNDDPLLREFTSKLEALGLALFGLDRRIRNKTIMRILSRLSKTPILEEWRNALVTPYRYCPPYWLDGSLERLARKLASRQ